MAGDLWRSIRVARWIAGRYKGRLSTLARDRKKARNTTTTHEGRVAGHTSCFIKAQHGGGGRKRSRIRDKKSLLLLLLDSVVHVRSASLRHEFARLA